MVFEGAIIYSNLLVLLALGLTLTYITTNVPNFAQGSFAVIGSYIALTFLRTIGLNPYYSLPILAVSGAIIGLFTYIILRPLVIRKASIEILMIATLAIDLIFLGIIGAYSELLGNILGSVQAKFVFSQLDFLIFGLKGILIVSTLTTIVLLGCLYLLLYKTKLGIALRASMENPDLAETVGINVEMTRVFSWMISGTLACIAGGLLPFMQEIVPATGSIIIISIFAASIVGGLRHISGALIGGYVIGMSESLITYYLSLFFGTGFLVYGKVVALIIMIISLLLFPSGLVEIKLNRKR